MPQSLVAITLAAALSASTLGVGGPAMPPPPTPAADPAPPMGPVPAPEPAPTPSPQAAEPSPAVINGLVVHVVPLEPDPTRGVLKLVQHRSTTKQAVGTNAVLITQLYDEICAEPCGVPVDVSERPVFYFIRDGQPVSKAFRLSAQTGDVTIRVKPIKKGMYTAGLYMTVFLLLPISIPLMVAGSPKTWIATGTPQSHGDWVKLKKAKI